MEDARDLLDAASGDAIAWRRHRDGPFRRAIRLHPARGAPAGWDALEAVPWSPAGRFHDPGIDPAGRLDWHTGLAWAQDAASQVPVLLLDPRPGEVVVDACAAPGSKTTQIGIALGADGLVVACDASPARRAILGETLARQGILAALVTPLPLDRLGERHPGAADAVLVDAPCCGHAPVSRRQVERQARKQTVILATAARLVRPGGRLVYSTCSPHPAEDEEVVAGFLAAHPGWRSEPVTLPGCDGDLAGLGGVRLWPHRQGSEPFFAIRLRAPGEAHAGGFAGAAPEAESPPPGWCTGGMVWRRGERLFAGSPQAATAALPSEARGLVLGRLAADGLRWEPWAVQAAIAAGAAAEPVPHDLACRLWAGEPLPVALPAHAWVRSEHGAPLGRLDGEGLRLVLPSRLRRGGIV